MSYKLPKSWPPTARRIVLDAARYYYREMSEPFPVPDVIMEQAIEWANKEMEVRRREIYEEASDRWIDRWESAKTDEEMKKAIDSTYDSLRRAERGLRSRSHASVRKSPRQLDAEIAQSLRRR